MSNTSIDLLKSIKQHWLFIAISVIVAVAVTGVISFNFLPPQYEATTTLLVQPQISENKISYDNLITNEKLVSTYAQIIKSHSVARDVIVNLKLPGTEKDLLQRVQVEGIKNSLVTAITVSAVDPGLAANIANAFAEAFQRKLPELMKVENISILDRADYKNSGEPVSPRPFLYMGVNFFLSINLSVAAALLRDFMDKSIKKEVEAEELLGIPVLATIPNYSGKKFRPKKVKETQEIEQIKGHLPEQV